jgi:hypothetical protein
MLHGEGQQARLETLVRGVYLRLLCAAMPCVPLFLMLHLDVVGLDAYLQPNTSRLLSRPCSTSMLFPVIHFHPFPVIHQP